MKKYLVLLTLYMFMQLCSYSQCEDFRGFYFSWNMGTTSKKGYSMNVELGAPKGRSPIFATAVLGYSSYSFYENYLGLGLQMNGKIRINSNNLLVYGNVMRVVDNNIKKTYMASTTGVRWMQRLGHPNGNTFITANVGYRVINSQSFKQLSASHRYIAEIGTAIFLR